METHCENCKGWDCSTCNAPGGRLYIPEELAFEGDPEEDDEFMRVFLDAISRPIDPDYKPSPFGCVFILPVRSDDED